MNFSPKYRRAIITVTLIAIVSITAGLGARNTPAAATTSPLPHGITHAHCNFKWFYILPYEHCSAVVQPGTVKDTVTRIKRYRGHIVGAASAIAGFLCAPAGPVAFACAVLAAWKADTIINALTDAGQQNRCVQISWNTVYGAPYPTGMNVVPYGQKPRYMWLYNSRYMDWDPVWGNPDACHTVGFPPNFV